MTESPFEVKSFLRSLTHRPGVYRMLDAKHKVLYVGKARDLKKRVSSYFQRTQSSVKTEAMMALAGSVNLDKLSRLATREKLEALERSGNLAALRFWPIPETDCHCRRSLGDLWRLRLAGGCHHCHGIGHVSPGDGLGN